MSMVKRAPLTGGKLAGLGGLGEFSATGVVDALNKPGVWMCDKAVQSGLEICGSTGVSKYTSYVLSGVLYLGVLALVMKLKNR